MDKQKKALLSREIDGIIIECALNPSECSEAGLMPLAIDFAIQFRCPYQLSGIHMRSLETDAERTTALRLEAKVNGAIRMTMRTMSSGLTGMSQLAVMKFTDQPKPIPRRLVRTCDCTASRRSPRCKMPVELCKHTAFELANVVPRHSARSPPKPSRSPPKTSRSPPKPSRSPPKTSRSPKAGGTRKTQRRFRR
jgi:hypothetical protein